MNRFSERLAAGPVLGAEGYLFELERRGYLQSGPYVPEVVLDYPDAVRELHREFLRCGADVMVAFTYYGHRAKLRQIGREGDLERLNRDALVNSLAGYAFELCPTAGPLKRESRALAKAAKAARGGG